MKYTFFAAWSFFLWSMTAQAVISNNVPKIEDVLSILRSNLPAEQAQALDASALKGLLAELQNRVILLTNPVVQKRALQENLLTKWTVYNDNFAYFRVGQVNGTLAQQIRKAYDQLAATNKLKGIVLDLRYAGGFDYREAAAVSDLFLDKELPLVRLEGEAGVVKSQSNADDLTQPFVVLVNHQTGGAAEALAGIFRESQRGLLIGSGTSGSANIFKEIEISNGSSLMVASQPVEIGRGKIIGTEGLAPDIFSAAPAAEERMFFDDPFKVSVKKAVITSTNLVVSSTNSPRRRMNEAELVRLQREGVNPEDERAVGEKETVVIQVVTDPPLARALDLLKGLSVLGQNRKI